MVLIAIQPHVVPCGLIDDIILLSSLIFCYFAVVNPTTSVQTLFFMYFMINLLPEQ